MRILDASRRRRASTTASRCPSCKMILDDDGVRRLRCPFCGASWSVGNEAEDQLSLSQSRTSSLHLPLIDARPNLSLSGRFLGRFSPTHPNFTHIQGFTMRNGEERPASPEMSTLPPIALGGGSRRLVSMETSHRSLPSSASKLRQIRSARTPSKDTPPSEFQLIATPNKKIQRSTVDIEKEDFENMVQRARETGNYEEVGKVYTNVFQDFKSISATFKRASDQDSVTSLDSGLNMAFVNAVNDAMIGMPSNIHRIVLKSVFYGIMDESHSLQGIEYVRALFVLLQAPMFAVQSSYTVFAHLLRHVTALPSSDHQLLVGWFKTLEIKRFSALVQHLLQFITVRRFPPADMSLPPMSKSKWWVPTATRVLALLNVANNTRSLPLIHYTDFYNSALDHLDLMDEYMSWQAPERPDRFSFCQYPFILSIVAKRYILTKDSEQQMILTARRSLVAKVSRHQIPDIEVFFLNISVRRAHLVPDSLREIGRRQRDLKKKLKVTFEGEPGLDMGGLTKEWFQLLIRQVFQPDYGMFVYHSRSRCYWFSLSQSGNLREYNLIGVLMGLAVYNSIILDLHFPHVCYRKLLSPPVVPNFEYVPVGLAREPSTIDLAEIMPEVASSLKDLLVHEGDVEEDFCMCFQVSVEEFGKVKTYNLKESGDQLPVTNENREEFVKLYLDFVLNSGIYEQFRAFYLGFHSVCASNALIMLRPEEVEMLVCGSPNCDLSELKKVVEYDGFTSSDPDILDFWEILLSLSTDLQKKFLLFTTGSDRIPVGGISEMTFKISAQRESLDMLPQAHTCFNQLVLPTYKNRNIMREKLTIAISNAEGFGLE